MFSLGLVYYLIIFVTLYQRLTSGNQFPTVLRPTYLLFFAAPSMASLAWKSITGAFVTPSKMLLFLSLFLFMSQVPFLSDSNYYFIVCLISIFENHFQFFFLTLNSSCLTTYNITSDDSDLLSQDHRTKDENERNISKLFLFFILFLKHGSRKLLIMKLYEMIRKNCFYIK